MNMKFEFINIEEKIKDSTESSTEDSIKNIIKDVKELELYFSANETQLLHFYEPELGLFAVESPMVIERALMAGYEPRSFVMIDSVAEEMCQRFSEIIKNADKTLWTHKTEGNKAEENKAEENKAEEKKAEGNKAEENKIEDNKSEDDKDDTNIVPVYVGSYETIAGLTGVNITRGVLSIMKRRTLPELSELAKKYNRIAVFDDVENPTNIGAMFRSAAALGVEAVIIAGSSSDPLYRRASRVSVGTVFQVPWTKLGKRDKTDKSYIEELHKMGFKTAAMALSDDSISISDERLKKEEKIALILGNEGVGLSDAVIHASDYVVKIPMKNNVDSLNVAAASSVAFWEIMNKNQ